MLGPVTERPILSPALVSRLHRAAEADRWQVSADRFADALRVCAAKVIGDRTSSGRELETALAGLHLADLALACACADGHEPAWEHFVREHRPVLYRAADAMAPGRGRELADSLYAELFGVSARGEARTSLFRYFHGRSSLGTWLRAVLAQRHVDRFRTERRLDPVPDGEAEPADTRPAAPPPERARWIRAVHDALARALATLDARDRLRLGCYYAEDMTLAEIGRMLGEHEATVSRHLTKSRRLLREGVERRLRDGDGMSTAEIAECLASVSADAGPLDLGLLLNQPHPGGDAPPSPSLGGLAGGIAGGRKADAADRST